MSGRRGFTLVELLVVTLVGSVVVLAAYQVLVSNQRTYTTQNATVQAQQTTRAAMEILFNELREISAGGGDIVDFDAQRLEVRTMRKVGVVCDNFPTTFSSTPQLLVRRVADPFEVGDSVFVFADNDEYRTSDDTWMRAQVTTVANGQLCAGTFDAQLLSFSGQSALFVADSVREGAPLRSFTRYEYSLDTWNGDTYLGRADAGGDWVPLVGPLTAGNGLPGLEMDFLDGSGNPTTTAADVRRVVLTVRTWSQARDQTGNLVMDSLTTSIFMRN